MTMPTPTLVTDGEKAEIKVKAAYSGYRTLVFSYQEHFVMFMFSLLQENTCDIHKVRNPSRRTSKWDASNLSVHAWSRVYDEMDWWRRCVFLLVAILNYLFYVLLHFFQVIHAPSLLRWKLMKLFVCMKWTMTQKSLSMVILYRMCILKLKLIPPPLNCQFFPASLSHQDFHALGKIKAFTDVVHVDGGNCIESMVIFSRQNVLIA